MQALKAELQSQPALLGSSVFGYDDIYRTYQPFVQQWRRSDATGRREPYVVTVDVSKAFDAVLVEKLLQIAMPILQSSQYLMVKYSEVPDFTAFVRHAIFSHTRFSFPNACLPSSTMLLRLRHNFVKKGGLSALLTDHDGDLIGEPRDAQ